jgi:hypothetical protein
MAQPLKQGEEAIQQDIMHLERIIRRTLKDPKRPAASRDLIVDHLEKARRHLKAVVTEMHNVERAAKPLRRTG